MFPELNFIARTEFAFISGMVKMVNSGPGPSKDGREVVFDVDTGSSECILLGFRSKNNVFVPPKTPLIVYSLNGSRKTFKSVEKGVITFKNELKVGSRLANGDVLGVIGGECPHEMVLADRDHEDNTRYVSMVHNKPGLMVSKKKATEIAHDTRRSLLDARKLILMVDLDQTVIHTTNKPPTSEEQQHKIHSFYLQGFQYHTKVRPQAAEFLESMSRLFELHVCTYGRREYAEKIVSILDPQKHLFAERVLTRDELRSQHDKSANLSSLFPVGEELVLMVDDRCDVWGFSDALIWVKPYLFFKDIGDINDPALFKKEKSEDDKGAEPDSNVSQELNEQDQPVNESNSAGECREPENRVQKSEKESLAVENNDDMVQDLETEDTVLRSISQVLSKIHALFFKKFDQSEEISHVRQLAHDFRLSVLKEEVIVFSGLPKYPDNRKHQLVSCAEAFGATVEDEVNERTTVLVACRIHTSKYMDAKHRLLPVVSPKWVEESAARWQNLDKRLFPITQTGCPSDCRLPQELTEVDDSMTTLARNDIQQMEAEVDDLLDDDSDEEPVDNGCRKRRVSELSEQEGDSSPSKVAHLDSEESSGDEMVADIENLLGVE